MRVSLMYDESMVVYKTYTDTCLSIHNYDCDLSLYNQLGSYLSQEAL